MNTKTTPRFAEIRQHRATVAGEVLGSALLALTRWLSMAARALRRPSKAFGALTAHTPR
jgi:hypothetical protein